MLTYTTAGESHGRCIIATISGLPYGLTIDLNYINKNLRRRQRGYGRSERMDKENDTACILSGVRNGKTISSPLTISIKNKESYSLLPPVTRPRPGHADLPGVMKLCLDDARDITERASARETAGRVAAGAIANYMLSIFDIWVLGYVVAISDIKCNKEMHSPNEISKAREKSIFYTLDSNLDKDIKSRIDTAKKIGDTLGGIFEVKVFNPPPGLGNFTSWGDKLDGNIARAIMSIQTVIGIEIGVGFPGSRLLGSQFHDTIVKKKKGILRTTNNAGGIEGGMTNGETIIIRVGCKPIPTLKNPIESFNIKTKKIAPAHYERSDICVLPALSVIGESVVAFEIARAFLAKFGADTFCEVKERFSSYKKKLKGLFYI